MNERRNPHPLSRPRAFWTRRTALSGLILAIAAGGAALWLTGPETASKIGGPFSLVDGKGVRHTDAEFRGKYLLVYFGYTFCPDICPTALGELSAALDRLPANKTAMVQVVFISVDPKRDSGERLDAYGKAFHDKIMGLTGTRAEIDAAAAAYGAKYRIVGDASGDDYSIDHTSIIHVMGKDGEHLTRFTHLATPEQMLAKLDAVIR